MIKPGVLMMCVCVCLCGTRSCIASRDPYCGWKPHGACERIQPGVLWVQASAAIWSANLIGEIRRIFATLQLISLSIYLFFVLFSGLDMNRTLNSETLPTWETVTVRVSSPCHAIYPETHTNTHTHRYTYIDTHMHICTQMKHKLISTHTMSLHTHTSNHSSNLPLHKSMCSINTHICIQYMATCNLCRLWGRNMDMYNYGSCSAGANGRGLKISDGQKMCLYGFYFKTSVPSFVPTKHDPGWTSVLIRTRGPLLTPVRKRHCQRVLFIFIVKPTELHS